MRRSNHVITIACHRTLPCWAVVGAMLLMSPGQFAAAQTAQGWRPTSGESSRYGGAPEARTAGQNTPFSSSQPITPIGPTATGTTSGGLTPINNGTQRAQVIDTSATLPQNSGLVKREYDIRPYTLRVQGVERPEQSIVDWILRETGYEAWHSEQETILSASREKLVIFHTPEMQALCAEIIDRFINTQADQSAFSLRIATVNNPNWRARALPLMTPIPVESPGVQGWLLAKEDAALLLAEFTRRVDHREYTPAGQVISNGQTVVVSTMRPRSYVKGIVPTAQTWPGYQPEMGQLEEGFALEFSPLLGLDMQSADAVVKLRLNQVERMLPVKLDIPARVSPNQRVQVEVPQMTTANMHERFRWPTDKVLLLSMGVVATPETKNENAFTKAVPIFNKPPRADALLMVECRNNVSRPGVASPSTPRAAGLPQQSYLGRY